jgi:hypothetical protein
MAVADFKSPTSPLSAFSDVKDADVLLPVVVSSALSNGEGAAPAISEVAVRDGGNICEGAECCDKIAGNVTDGCNGSDSEILFITEE